MRFFFLLFMCLSFFALPVQMVCAQDNALPGLSDAITNGDKDAEASPEPKTATEKKKEENIFASASDKQIKEAQSYYRMCRKNEVLSRDKDCQCAATKFLETRMLMGDDISVNEIIKVNINKCLKSPEVARINTEMDLSNVTPKQMDEANYVYEYCTASADYKRHYDCDCFAANILNERIKNGPIPSWQNLARNFEGKCTNVVDQTGAEYSICMSSPAPFVARNFPKDQFCECYAREWGKKIESFKGELNVYARQSIQQNTYMQCSDPSLYK